MSDSQEYPGVTPADLEDLQNVNHVPSPQVGQVLEITAVTDGRPTWEAGSGGGGLFRVLAFPFAFDTPNLTTGAVFYRPTVGDILLDAWFQIDTAWNGTTPQGDFGTFLNGGSDGFLGNNWGANDFTVADSNLASIGSDNLLVNYTNWTLQAAAYEANIKNNQDLSRREVPAKFTTADPLKLVVTQTGQIGDPDPGSTQGSAVLYLFVATPQVITL